MKYLLLLMCLTNIALSVECTNTGYPEGRFPELGYSKCHILNSNSDESTVSYVPHDYFKMRQGDCIKVCALLSSNGACLDKAMFFLRKDTGEFFHILYSARTNWLYWDKVNTGGAVGNFITYTRCSSF